MLVLPDDGPVLVGDFFAGFNSQGVSHHGQMETLREKVTE
jgi:hypothetical protein